MKSAVGAFILLVIHFQLLADPYNTYEENGKIGLKDEHGDVVIPAKYESLGWTDGKFSLVGNVTGYKLNGLWGLINLDNHRVTPAEFVSLMKGNNSLVIATKRSPLTFRTTTGCLNESGKILLPFNYTGIELTDLRAIVFVRDGGVYKYGVIDFNNKLLIPMKYKSIVPIGSLRFAVENFEGQFALFAEDGKPVTAFEIESISSFKNNVALFSQNGFRGVINREGIILHQPVFSEIQLNPLKGRKPDNWSVLTCDNKVEKVFDADSVVQIANDRFKIVKAGHATLVDENFDPLGEKQYQFISNFNNGLAIVRDAGKLGVINPHNLVKLPAQFDIVRLSGDFIFAATRSGNKFSWQVFDKEGTKISTKLYDAIEPYNGKFFPVKKNGFWGGLDKYGVEILSCVNDEIIECKFDRVVVKFKGLYGIVTLKEDWIVTPRKNKLRLISETRFFEQSDDLLFLKSYDNFIYYFTTNPVKVTDTGLIEQTSIGAIWTINFDGQIIKRQEAFDGPVEKMFPSSEGLRGIKKDGRYGFIDDRGRLRVANRYEGIQPFSEGLAAMKILGKWGFIDHDEKIVVQPNFDEVTPFENGFSIVKQNGLFGLINSVGELILPARYEDINPIGTGKFLLTYKELKGLANDRGRMLIQCKYHGIQDLGNNFAIVELYDKMGVVNLNGVSTVPLQYDYMYFDPNTGRIIAQKRNEWINLDK